MVRERYLELLESVELDMTHLCEMSCTALNRSVRYLEIWDKEASAQLIKEDAHINESFINLQEKIFQIIARQQPVAGDLRFLGSSLTVANNLERCGDYATDIAKTVVLLKPRIVLGVEELKALDRIGEDSLRLSIDGFVKRDMGSLGKVSRMEEESDKLFGKLLDKMKKSTKTCKDSEILFRTAIIGRHLERFSDRAVNISNKTGYVVTADRKYLR